MLPVPYTAILRVCIVLLGAPAHTKDVMDGREADLRHKINGGHLRMSLDEFECTLASA